MNKGKAATALAIAVALLAMGALAVLPLSERNPYEVHEVPTAEEDATMEAQETGGGIDWDAQAALAPLGERVAVFRDMPALEAAILAAARPGDQVLVMSNGGFGGIHGRLLSGLGSREGNGK